MRFFLDFCGLSFLVFTMHCSRYCARSVLNSVIAKGKHRIVARELDVSSEGFRFVNTDEKAADHLVRTVSTHNTDPDRYVLHMSFEPVSGDCVDVSSPIDVQVSLSIDESNAEDIMYKIGERCFPLAPDGAQMQYYLHDSHRGKEAVLLENERQLVDGKASSCTELARTVLICVGFCVGLPLIVFSQMST